ncbi:MAG: hypothetical protein FWH10_00495 [Oscillospiraceae bacterium]|nr:hypothetical protein [Oscillospiraceae bacterium]
MSEKKQSAEPTKPVQAAAPASALKYKGRPLVRKGDVICYGDAKSDDYVLVLDIKEKKREKGIETASDVLISIQSSDPELKETVKFGRKESLYAAFEIGEIWLESYLK